MTSERKILANRQNAKHSTGPKTTTGKSRASRNAVRHGLEAVSFGNTGHSAQVERLAKAICQDTSDPFRYEQAIIIAESQIFVARVRAARVAAIEQSEPASDSSISEPEVRAARVVTPKAGPSQVRRTRRLTQR